jgi:secreted trypsin-like serine protease
MRLNRKSNMLAAGTTAVIAAAFLSACGTQQNDNSSDLKIVGGTDVPSSQQDARLWSTVALTTDIVRPSAPDQPPLIDQNHSFCTGTIVNARTIVTAAHCLQGFDPETRQKLPGYILPEVKDFVIFFGNKVDRNGSWIRAAKVVPHPDWDPNQTLSPSPNAAPNDIGVIVLSADIPASAKPVAIADQNLNLPANQDTFLAGFGVTRSRNDNDTGTLRQVTTPLTKAENNLKRFTVGQFFRGACAGDSGGPAYIKVNGEFQVAGATSTGAELAGNCLGLVNNYTDVRFYKGWIESVSQAETGLAL